METNKPGVYLVGKNNTLEFTLDEYLKNHEWYDNNGYNQWAVYLPYIPISDAGYIQLCRIANRLRRLDTLSSSDRILHLQNTQKLIDQLVI